MVVRDELPWFIKIISFDVVLGNYESVMVIHI